MNKKKLTIALGSDHAGYLYKKQWLTKYSADYTVQDFGAHTTKRVDYPDFAHVVAQGVQTHTYDYGILLCGSGNGMAMTANQYPGVRAALCWNETTAILARQHNDARILCVPTRFISFELFEIMAQHFLTTDFEGGRHIARIKSAYI